MSTCAVRNLLAGRDWKERPSRFKTPRALRPGSLIKRTDGVANPLQHQVIRLTAQVEKCFGSESKMFDGLPN